MRSEVVESFSPFATSHMLRRPTAASAVRPSIASRMRYSLKSWPFDMYGVSIPTSVTLFRCDGFSE